MRPIELPPFVIANPRDPYESRREKALAYIRERRIQIPSAYPKEDEDDGKVVSMFHKRQAGG